MPVQTKSIYDPRSADDGVRVLATQYWPRGVARDRIDEYKRRLGPSRDLLRDFKDGRIGWPEYERRYLAEMQGDAQKREIDQLAGLARTNTVTVMCVCRTDDQCHRRPLKRLIEQRTRRSSA